MMNTQNPHFHFSADSATSILPVSAFSAYNILRNYNYLLTPQNADLHAKLHPSRLSSDCPLQSPNSEELPLISCVNSENPLVGLSTKPFLTPSSLFNYHQTGLLQSEAITVRNSNSVSPCGVVLNQNYKRQRGEKKPIPEEQKDEKYFERRRRNNQAAKKSRDARKLREDQIALKATILEHENAILKAQLITLREEASSLRQMLLQKKALELVGRDVQACRS